ncbi:unnamed protein product [Lupinus luteus]|uniref:Uncharacterized protein n=1 Tax=Lupinus luteus TaxID=3873 RepID=A0AAV1W877_LUPLU
MEQTLWGHLPLLLRASTKESIEYILETLWRTRKTGLDSSHRRVIQDTLQLQNHSDLDPVGVSSSGPTFFIPKLLLCLRMLMRRCVYENTSKDDIPKLFPNEVLPELQKLLTLLLQKFQQEWQEELLKDQNIVPRLKAMTWNMGNQDKESSDPVAVINMKLQGDAQLHSREQDVKFQLATDTLDTVLKAMHCIRDQFSTTVNIMLKFVLLSRLGWNSFFAYLDCLIGFLMSLLYVVRMRHRTGISTRKPMELLTRCFTKNGMLDKINTYCVCSVCFFREKDCQTQQLEVIGV